MHDMRRLLTLVEGVIAPYTGDGPLYHGTDLISLAQIVASDEIHPSIDQDSEASRGVSLTTNLRFAWGFAGRSSRIEQDHMLDWFDGTGPDPKTMPLVGGVLEFDSGRLRRASGKLMRYFDHTLGLEDDSDEAEVRVIGGAMKVSPYLTALHFDPAQIQWFIDYMRGEPRDTHADGADWTIGALAALLKHPLRKG